MKFLLDTHTFLWWIMNDSQLSKSVIEIMQDGGNQILISAASGWEIAIKYHKGRLTLPETPEKFVTEQISANAFQPLPIFMPHVLRVASLPQHHQDPFDRLLIAQSMHEQAPILTSDSKITEYAVDVVW